MNGAVKTSRALSWPIGGRAARARTAETDAATRTALIAFFTSRVIVWGAALIALAAVGRDQLESVAFDPLRVVEPFPSSAANTIFGPAARWDSVWYLEISKYGYFSKMSSAYFPLYPLLIRLGTDVFGSAIVVGTLISFACSIIALYLLYLLVRLDMSASVARTTVLLVAFFPTALFLSAVYTEGLFLMLSVGAFYAARNERWAIACVVAGLASAARSDGVLLLAPLALIYLYGPRAGGRRRPAPGRLAPRYALTWSATWLAVVPVGLIAFLAYLGVAHHAPLAPFQAQKQFWGRAFAGPFSAVLREAEKLPHQVNLIVTGRALFLAPGDPLSFAAHSLIDVGFLAFAVAGVAFAWRRVPVAYTAYALLALMAVTSNPDPHEPLASLPRYVLVIFPIFIGWASKVADRAVLRYATLVPSAVLLAGASALWGHWAWVA